MLVYEDSRITHEKRNLKIGLLHLFSSHYVTWNIFCGNLNSKKYSASKRKWLEWLVLKESPSQRIISEFNFLALANKFLLSLLLLAVDNMKRFHTYSAIHNINTRYSYSLHVSIINLSKYQVGAYSTGIQLFSNLSPTIICFNQDINCFSQCSKRISHLTPSTLQNNLL
jgi:hypothetical protein